jgi:hypothetical protein
LIVEDDIELGVSRLHRRRHANSLTTEGLRCRFHLDRQGRRRRIAATPALRRLACRASTIEQEIESTYVHDVDLVAKTLRGRAAGFSGLEIFSPKATLEAATAR